MIKYSSKPSENCKISRKSRSEMLIAKRKTKISKSEPDCAHQIIKVSPKAF
jgi:hypothetical protein